jgi:hypothetical protein
MYNIYIHEKNLDAKKKEKTNKEKQKKFEDEHKKKTDELSEKYKTRIQNFLYDMITNPVIIKNPSYDKLNKTETKSFIFKNFQTDKQRLSQHLKENFFYSTQQNINKYPYTKLDDLSESSNSEYLPAKKKVYQPIMRFKPRNDAERILDELNLNGINELSHQNIYKKIHQLIPKSSSLPPPSPIQNNKIEVKIPKKINVKKNNKFFKKYNIDTVKNKNSRIVKKVTQDYHIKTFFNAAEQFSLILPDLKNNNMKLVNLKNKLKKNNSTGDIYNIKKNEFIKEILSISRNPFKFKDENEKKKNLQKHLRYLYKLSNSENFYGNVYNNQKNFEINLKDNLKYDLKDSDDMSSLTKEFNNHNYYINEDDEIIQIDNKSYLKKDLKNISKHILKKCHFLNKKFNDSKENYLEEGKGKLMITNGLSLKEFTKKYNLPFLTKIESNQLI